MSARRVTQKEIARKAGLTQAAVSLALAGHPSIPPETRRRVGRLAKELGYRPDPFLSGLSAYRKAVRPAALRAALAWLNNHPVRDAWRRSVVFQGYFDGAARRARELGYQLEEHWLHEEGMTPARMERILAARGVSGVLVAPQPGPNMELGFRFKPFSAVAFGYTMENPPLHRVALHQFRAMRTACRKLRELGYRRLGMAFDLDSDERADHNWSAAFRSEQLELRRRDRIPPLLGAPLDRPAFAAWFRRHRPDVVLAIWPVVHGWLLEVGGPVPERTGFAMISVPDEGRTFSGVWENPQVAGAKAVEFLVDMIHRNERGVPEIPVYLLVDGTWKDGLTVRNLSV